MFTSYKIFATLAAVSALPVAFSAPVYGSASATASSSVGNTTSKATSLPEFFLENAKLAQNLNAVFKDIKATDACETQDSACIDGNISVCVAGNWTVSHNGPCDKPDLCFAIPDTKASDAVLLSCTTEQNALGIFTAAGLTDGIFGSGNATETTSTKEEQCANHTHPSVPASEPSTTTVIVIPTDFSSAVPSSTVVPVVTVTKTFTPEEASIFLSSASAAAQTTLSSSVVPSSSASNVSSSVIAESSASGSVVGTITILSTTTVFLSAGQVPTTAI